MDFCVRFFNRGSTGYRSVAVWLRFLCAMSDVEEVSEQSASRRGKPPVVEHNSEAFEAFGLFRDYLDSKLSDLRKDINDQTSKLKRKALCSDSNHIEFSLNLILIFRA